MSDGPVLSFLQPKGPRRPDVVKHLNIDVHRPRGTGGFLNGMAHLALIATGWGAVWAFSAFPPGSPSDIAGTIALCAWMAAAVQAIIEHSQAAELKKINGEDQEIIKKAIDQFTKS